MEGRLNRKVAVKEGEDPKNDPGHQKLKGEKMNADAKEEKCQVSCYEAPEEANCAKDPEDVLLNPNKMTPEEMKDYLDSLLQSRSLGH